MKRKIYLLLALLLALTAFSGCSFIEDVNAKLNPVLGTNCVAIVGNESVSMELFEATLAQSLEEDNLNLDTAVSYYGEEEFAAYKNYIVEQLVIQQILLQKAKELSLDTISSLDQSDIDANIKYLKQTIYEAVEETMPYSRSNYTDAEWQAKIQSEYDEYIEQYHYTDEMLEESYRRNIILDRVKDYYMQNYSFNEEYILKYYNDLLEYQQQIDADDPQTAINNYIDGTYGINLYVPTEAATVKMRRIKHILIGLSDEVLEEYKALLAEGDKEEEAQAFMRTERAKIVDRAQEALDRALAGEDFDALIDEYNTDPGMDYYTNGYLMYDGCTDFVDAFYKASMKLSEPGDITESLVSSDYGYHIILYASDVTAGEITSYGEVRDSLEASAREYAEDEYWNEIQQGLLEATEYQCVTFAPETVSEEADED